MGDVFALQPFKGRRLMQAIQKVVEGNCLAHLRTMTAGSVAAVVASPPYNLGKAYSS